MTQIFADIRNVEGLLLANHLSGALATRCLCVEVTDDAYNTHALFESGVALELALDCTSVDVMNILKSLELPIPDEYAELDPDDFEETTYFHSSLDPSAGERRELEALAQQVGVYLHTPYFEDGTALRLVEVGDGDVVRMDLLSRAE